MPPDEFRRNPMKTLHLTAVMAALLCTTSWAQTSPTTSAVRLASLINAYRIEHGLPAIPVSVSLTRVAQVHAQDLEQTRRADQCNMHSWSAAGAWSSCCYTSNHAQAQCMWVKPRELTRGTYQGDGYEIAFGASGVVTPEGALRGWKNSLAHHAMIVNKNMWAASKWQAMGVAVTNHHALVWFGEAADPANNPSAASIPGGVWASLKLRRPTQPTTPDGDSPA